jgi:hypothetical protein
MSTGWSGVRLDGTDLDVAAVHQRKGEQHRQDITQHGLDIVMSELRRWLGFRLGDLGAEVRVAVGMPEPGAISAMLGTADLTSAP